MSAERGWIVEPPPPRQEWHLPAWVKTVGRHFHSGISTLTPTEEQEAKSAELPKIDHSHIPTLRVAAQYAGGRPEALRRRQLARD